MPTHLSGWTITKTEPFDVAIVDFPDPNNFALGNCIPRRFYNLLKQKLRPENAAVVIQTTSPLIARKSFWCVIKTLEASGFYGQTLSDDGPELWHLGFCSAKTPTV